MSDDEEKYAVSYVFGILISVSIGVSLLFAGIIALSVFV